MDKAKRIGIVLFGGTGQRFASPEPKQFLPCGDHPLMAETLLNLTAMPCFDELYIVTLEDYIDETNELIDTYVPQRIKAVIPGGTTRHESVYNALEYLEAIEEDPNALIAIFDGDRPGIHEQIVEENFLVAEKTGAAVTAIKATDSIFMSSDGIVVDNYVDRNTVYLAQTPQTFAFHIILEAYRSYEESTTDDASLVRNLGYPVEIVLGNHDNDKITYPEDLVKYLSIRRNL